MSSPTFSSDGGRKDPSRPTTPSPEPHVPLVVLRKDSGYSHLRQDSPGMTKNEFLPTSLPYDAQLLEEADGRDMKPPVDAIDGGAINPLPQGRPWIPFPLRNHFVIPWITVNMLGAMAMEVALYSNNKSQGWGVIDQDAALSSAHFIYTIPPAAVAIIVVSGWGFLDAELKRLQPFVSLSQGRATAEQSILLDYYAYNKFLQWIPALRFRHYAVFLSTVIALFALVVQPLASGLFVVRSTQYLTNTTITSYADVGLNPNYGTMIPFAAAAGYEEAKALYNLSPPPFIWNGWTVGEFDIPQGMNGSVIVQSVAFLTLTNCQAPDSVNLEVDGGGYTLRTTWSGCTQAVSLDTSPATQYGVAPVTGCPTYASRDAVSVPVVFWIFDTSGSTAQNSVAFCDPTMQISNVQATADMYTGMVTNAIPLSNYTGDNNVTGQPLNGRPLNGVSFNLTNPDSYVNARINATLSSLSDAVYQTVMQSSGGLQAIFATGSQEFLNVTEQVYGGYLSSAAKGVVFMNTGAEVPAVLREDVQRLWMTPYAAHALAAVLLFAAFLGIAVDVIHKRSRRRLRLPVPTGTIGVTASMSRELEKLLHGVEDEQHMARTLRNRRFRLDDRGIIIMEGS